ncbi:MAG: response regulator [Myxococcales bacterium]|nr:response regulator [Myxococcales bacterium]
MPTSSQPSERILMQDYPILYVDDEAPNLDVFEAVFGDTFVVHLAQSGQEALDLLDVERVAVVVADNRMPNMSGIELFEQVSERFPTVKRVLCTAYSDQQTAIEAINVAGVQHYLVKPWDASKVEALLRNLIASAHLEQSAHMLKAGLIERERLAALAGMRSRMTDELGNIVSVLRAVDKEINHSLSAVSDHLDPNLMEDLREHLGMLGDVNARLSMLHKSAKNTHSSGGSIVTGEHAAREVVESVARMVWHELVGSARLDYMVDADVFFWADAVGVTRILIAAIAWSSRRVKLQAIHPPVIQLRVRASDGHVHFDVVHPSEGDANMLRSLLDDGLEAIAAGEVETITQTLAVSRDLAVAMKGQLDVNRTHNGACLRLSVPRAT